MLYGIIQSSPKMNAAWTVLIFEVRIAFVRLE